MRAAIVAVLLALVLLGCRSTVVEESPSVPAHAMVFEIGETGTITPYAYVLRNRTLEPRSEREIAAVLADERAHPPVREGHIAIRARDRWGRVIYRTLVEVVLIGHTICCPHTEFRVHPLSFSVIVPATAVSISFEGWQPASRVRLDIETIKSSTDHS